MHYELISFTKLYYVLIYCLACILLHLIWILCFVEMNLFYITACRVDEGFFKVHILYIESVAICIKELLTDSK